MQAKEVPMETFFHKIVMVRDRLRVLEQNINSNKKLSEEDKIEIQQYITRAYGSLTTFNVLFAEKDDYFVGQKAK
jgi:protein-arginine kinase